MSEIIFKGSKVQVGDRIKIPKPIIDTLKIKTGQKITIKFDVNKKEIIIKEAKKRKK